MLVTGGSDWHGDATAEERAALGALDVPIAWLQRMEGFVQRGKQTPHTNIEC
jgi:hypothetical protein